MRRSEAAQGRERVCRVGHLLVRGTRGASTPDELGRVGMDRRIRLGVAVPFEDLLLVEPAQGTEVEQGSAESPTRESDAGAPSPRRAALWW